MYFLNTDMHMVTFTITMFELVMLVFQIIYFLQRPTDKRRLQYLILLLCLIAHNICSGLFPDDQFIIPIQGQMIIAYLVGFIMSMYVIYYFYKVFDLKDLRFFATYGVVIFLFLPFVFLFLVPYLLTGDVRLSAKLTVVIPFLYALGFIYYTARGLIRKFQDAKRGEQDLNDPLYEHAIVAFISLVCWASLPVIVFFGDFQVLEHSVTNAGFLMMTIIYVRSSIKQSRLEYNKLIESERNLQQLNKDLKRKVRKRTRRLEQMIEERKTTFMNLAHETKTPLTLINNYVDDYIQKHGDSQEILLIKSNLERLTTDIVNFFDVESYEKGFSIYNHEQISDFSALINGRLMLFQSLAMKKGLDFQFRVEEGVFIKANPGALDRITNNLIENAIKYSQRDGEINIRLEKEDNLCRFSVWNSGDAIPSDFHEKVFDPYFKISQPGRKVEGMGMGLSIVKKIVDDLEGVIQLESNDKSGTRLEVLLPLADPEHRGKIWIDNQTVAVDNNAINNERPIILLVEDNQELVKYLVGRLSQNYNVIPSFSGRQALEKLPENPTPELIISDVMMDDMDGFEFCAEVYKNARYRHVPFIFLTAKTSGEDKIRGLELGAIDYIEKPFKTQELIIKIDSVLGNLRKQREALIDQAYRNLATNPKDILKGSLNAFSDNVHKYRLTAREVEVVKLLFKGLPYKLIGDQLHISDKTVTKHISNIFSKVGVGNKVELINKLEVNELSELSSSVP